MNQNTNVDENVLLGGGKDFEIDLSNITEETVGAYSTNILLSVIKKYERNYHDLSLQQQKSLTLCITEYQVKAMSSLNKLYLGDVGISCMLFNAFANMKEVIRSDELNGGNLSKWMTDTVALTRESTDFFKKKVRDLATNTARAAKTVAKAAYNDIEKMPLDKKLNIIQNLFTDMLKWGGKQLMIRLRAPEFDVASISDKSAFKEEIIKFIGNRINQIMRKSQTFREQENTQKEYLVWLLSVLDNMKSLLQLIKTISDLSTKSLNADFGIKMKMSSSMSTGVKVNIEPSEWLKDIGDSVDSLKSIVEEKQKTLSKVFTVTLSEIIRDGEDTKKAREIERQLFLLNFNIADRAAILLEHPNNNLVRAEHGRLIKLRDTLLDNKKKKSQEIEETCIQLLQEIKTYLTAIELPNVPLDIISKKILSAVAVKVDYTAFTSVANDVKDTAVAGISKIDIGLKTYFTCIGKYLEFCPNIGNIFKHIGFLPLDFTNIIDKLGTISGFVGDVASGAGAYLQAANICLLIIHLIVAATLNSRNKTLNKEKVTLEDIKKASQERIAKSGIRGGKRKMKGGMFPEIRQSQGLLPSIKQTPSQSQGFLPSIRQSQSPSQQLFPSIKQSQANLPPMMQSQGRMFKMRQGLVDTTHNSPIFVQGHKAVLNERIRNHVLYLLEPQYTKKEILSNVLSKSINSSSLLAENLISNVDAYMYANENSLDNKGSVLDNLKKQFPELNVQEYYRSNCNSVPSQTSLEEEVYFLSIFARYQGEQLRNSFGFDGSIIKPSSNILYCSATQKMEMSDPVTEKIILSVVDNFNGNINELDGGRTRRLRKKEKEELNSFLETKTTKQLYLYASSKNIRVHSKMSKKDLIQTIIKMKTL